MMISYLYKDWEECDIPYEDPEDTQHNLQRPTGHRTYKHVTQSLSWKIPTVPDYINDLKQVRGY